MEQTIFDRDRSQLMIKAAEALIAALRPTSAKYSVLGVPGGRSVAELFAPLRHLIAALPEENRRALRIFLVDERCVPLTSDESNAFLVEQEFVGPLVNAKRLSSAQLRVFKYRHDLPDWGLGAYRDDFLSHGGKLDVVVLGVGEDGHVASLFPNHPAWSGSEGERPFLPVDNAPKPPARRITASPALLKKCSVAMLLFLGEEKRQALEAFRRGEADRSCPARILAEAPHLFVVTDLAENLGG